MASELEPPSREKSYQGHQCCCDIENGNRCDTWIDQPDQPVCDTCLTNQHPEMRTFLMIYETRNRR